MSKIDVAGLKIDALTKNQLLYVLQGRIKSGQKTWVTTPYSEFLHAALLDPSLMQLLNQADIAAPDGIGLFWAARFLSLPLTAKSYWGKILQSFWQAFYCLCAILVYPKFIYNPKGVILRSAADEGSLKSDLRDSSSFAKASADRSDALGITTGRMEKIPGADLIWDLAKLAAENNFSIYLLGGFGDTSAIAAKRLTTHYPLLTTHSSNKNPEDQSAIDDLKNAAPDVLLVAYGPIKQERWIAANINNLPIKLAIGLGGTFDYLAGKQLQPPKILRQIGLEWLWRLFTQPGRAGRIYNAFFGLINLIILEKIYRQMPLRKNAVSVILNRQNQVLLCRRNPKPAPEDMVGEHPKKFADYWQLPQGGIEDDLNVIEGAKREALEETGIKNIEYVETSKSTHDYRFPLSWQRIIRNDYRFRGQTQSIIYFKFTGQESEIKIDQDEFIDYTWINISELNKKIASERIKLTKIVMDDLKEMQEKAII